MIDQYQNSQNNIYAVLDAARIFGKSDVSQSLQTNFLSLFMGQSEDLLSSAAPYLFSYRNESEFGKWLFEKGWGKGWGIYVETKVAIEELRKHFRKFLVLKSEEGNELYFRFYDPVTLRTFLPTCNTQQLIDFFGPIKMFVMESDDADYANKFVLEDGQLVYRKIVKEELSKSINKSQNHTNDVSVSNTNHTHKTLEEPLTNKSSTDRKWSFLVE